MMAVKPLEAAENVLGRARALHQLAPNTNEDLDRLALVMGVAAIDTYFHWRVHRVDLNSTSIPKKLAELDVPFEALLQSGKKSVDARKEGISDRPMVRTRNVLHNVTLGMTFQKARDVETAFNLVGISKPWRNLAASMGQSADSIKKKLNALAHRRNRIVHEGDIQRKSKPHRVKLNELDSDEVADSLDWIDSFLKAVDNL